MKGGLCVIYTSLLTISVLSSYAFLVLLVSAALQVNGEVNDVDLSGLHNVSQKVTVESENELPVQNSVEERTRVETAGEKPLEHQEMTFPDTLSLNSVTTDGLPDAGQPPILVSLADTAKLEIKNPNELLFGNEYEQDKENDTKTFTIADNSDSLKPDSEKEKKSDVKEDVAEPHLIVQAKPMHELRQTKDAFQTTPAPTDVDTTSESQSEEQSVTDKPTIPVKPDTPQEDIPSFSEWAQKQLAEAEKKDTVLNQSSQPSHSNTNFSSKNTKIRSKNYASPACGAKIVAANPESGSASSILSPNRDEYMLNTCNSRIWFVVELCEPVQAQKIEIANFELFSSTPKDIAVSFADRFPTREWASVGQFAAQDMRDIQSFDLFPHLFGKFIKVEMLSHHGSEHYCPISMFKVYGTSEFEVLEKESSQHTALPEDDDDEIIDIPDVPTAAKEPSKNLFGSARDAVMSIMKKAAQALVKSEVPKNVSSEQNDTSATSMYKQCRSPSHIIVCDNCSETLYNEVYELISCSSDRLTNLIRIAFLRDTLKCTGVCRQFGLDFKSTKTIEFGHERAAYLNAIFPPKYLAALCNMLAIKEKKVVLNTSFETELNVTTNLTEVDSNLTTDTETNTKQEIISVPIKNNISLDKKSDEIQKTEDSTVVPEIVIKIENKLTSETPVEEKDMKSQTKTDNKSDEAQPPPTEEKPQEIVNNSVKLVIDEVKPTDAKTEQENKDTKVENKNGKTDSTTEKPKENGNNGGLLEDVGDQIIIDTDSFMSDLDQMAVDPTPPGFATQNQNQAQTIQKESVFLRLSNRVKALERNMSLSGQYLEELSRRYKKQVEEMQKSFEKTILQMTDERRKSNEREQKYLEQMTIMQEQLTQVAAAMLLLMEERDSWLGNITFFKFLIYQIIIVAGVVYYIKTKRKSNPIIIPVTKRVKKKQDKMRRKSVEGVSGHETPSAKKRRPSEEALQIARQSASETHDDEGEWIVARKNRRRKISMIRKPLDYDSKTGLLRQDSIGKLQENPIPLDDDEFLAPVSEPTEFEVENSVSPHKELPKTNGSIFNNFKNKTMKTRRLSSPAFLRTLSRQSSRSTPSPVVKTGQEPVFNGKVNKKSSESPTGSLWSESTDLSQIKEGSINGAGKKKKSFKNIFKKVF